MCAGGAAGHGQRRPAARGGGRCQKPSESEGLPVTEASGAESDPGALTMYHTFGLFANSLQETAIAPSCWAGLGPRQSILGRNFHDVDDICEQYHCPQ